MDISNQHRQIQNLMIEAGQKALSMREEGQLETSFKSADENPYSIVTEADKESSRILTTGLQELFPDTMIISEEQDAHSETGEYDNAIIIDPIDGTRGFSSGGNNFGVLVGFVENKNPVRGYAYYPGRTKSFYFTHPSTKGAFSQVAKTTDGLTDFGSSISLENKPNKQHSNRIRI